MVNLAEPGWLILIISLPGRSATLRMRIWRAMKNMGVAVLRDGVYLLPGIEGAQEKFQQQSADVVASGGVAYLLPVNEPDPAQNEAFVLLFDRTPDYARLVQEASEIKSGLELGEEVKVRRSIKQLRKSFDDLAAIDYFPGPAREQVQSIILELEKAADNRFSPHEPREVAGEIRRLRKEDYQGRVWATRRRPWVDRLASVWLVRRFIDPQASIVWLKTPQDCQPDAVGLDFDGANFTHVGGRVTFEVLLASFALEADRGLSRLGSVIHFLDLGGVPVAEAAGLETILNGARRRCPDDDALLAEAEKIFDFLYVSYAEENAKEGA